MEQTQTKEKKKSQLPDFRPCNTYLLCKKIEIPEMVGNIVLADTDKWRKEFEVVASSPDLLPYLDHYDVGDKLLYPIGTQTLYINIDGSDYYFLDKKNVVSKL